MANISNKHPSETGCMPVGNYAFVNGLKLYYEIHGTGRPLILQHGGLGTSSIFGEVLPWLAQSCQAIAVDQKGHGRVNDAGFMTSYPALWVAEDAT